MGCPLVVHYSADLQSVHGLRCYDNIARTRNVSECLYSLYDWLSTDVVQAGGSEQLRQLRTQNVTDIYYRSKAIQLAYA